MVEFLIASGSDRGLQDLSGRTAADLAASETIRLLLASPGEPP